MMAVSRQGAILRFSSWSVHNRRNGMRLRSVLPAFFMAFAGAFSPAGLAQDRPSAEAPEPANADLKHAVRGLIEDALKVSHAAQIFADLRGTLREVYIPALRDIVQGGLPG